MITPTRSAKINVWLIFSTLAALALSYGASATSTSIWSSALRQGSLLMRQTSKESQKNSNDTSPYGLDDSLILNEAKENKVSKALRYLHNKTGEMVFKQNGSAVDADLKAIAADEPSDDKKVRLTFFKKSKRDKRNKRDEREKLDERTDDQTIEDVSKNENTRTCALAVKIALNTDPEKKAKIAKALKRKPEHVSACNLLCHKLFELLISKVEQKGYDEKLDTGLNFLSQGNIYLQTATGALNLANRFI